MGRSSLPGVSAAPSPTRRAPRWGLGDVVWIWFVGLVAGAFAGSGSPPCDSGRGTGVDPDGLDLAIGLFAQNGAMVLALAFGVSRAKGGALRRTPA